MIPYGKQSISDDDVERVIDVLRSDFLTQGNVVPEFEKSLALKCSADYAVATTSATSALHIACLSLGIGRGDHVWTVPNTFVASANCARYCNAEVDFVDIDSDSWCLSPKSLEEKLERHSKEGRPLPTAVIPVHFGGQSCEMKSIAQLGEKWSFKIIEDASHALGGTFQDRPIGSCQYSDIAVFSFHPVKPITTGEGGTALTNSEEIYRRMKLFREHGIFRESPETGLSFPEPWRYEQHELGFNFRMTEIQGALGLSQLNKLKKFTRVRNDLADNYEDAFEQMDVKCQFVPSFTQSARHLFVVKVPEVKRKAAFQGLRDAGIGVNVHYLPVHLQPYYRRQGFTDGSYPISERHGREAITLPLYPSLTDYEQEHVIETLDSLLRDFS